MIIYLLVSLFHVDGRRWRAEANLCQASRILLSNGLSVFKYINLPRKTTTMSILCTHMAQAQTTFDANILMYDSVNNIDMTLCEADMK